MSNIKEMTHKTDEAHLRGLRSVGAVEISKGVLALVGAIAVAWMLQRHVDLQEMAWAAVNAIHIDPDRKLAQLFIDAAAKAMHIKSSTVVIGAAAYSALRFIEGYGLWKARVWAEWMALLSGAIYLPWEIRAVIHKPNAIHWSFLFINLAILAYIAWVRFGEHWMQAHKHVRQEPEVSSDGAA